MANLKPGGGLLEDPDKFDSDVRELTSNLEDLLRAHQEVLGHISEGPIQDLHRDRIGQLEGAIEALKDTDLPEEEGAAGEVFLLRLREVLLEALAGPPAA